MLDHLLDAHTRPRSSGRSWPVLSVSVTVHVAAIGSAVIAALLSISPIHPPDLREVLVLLPRPPAAPLAAAAAPPGTRQRRPAAEHEAEARPPADNLQPAKPTADLAPEKLASDDLEEDWDDPAPAGLPDGVPGGIDGGIPGGVVGGSVDGIPGGDLDGSPFGVRGGIGTGEEPGEPLHLAGGIRKPRAIFKPEPRYPPLARRSRAEGDVVLEIVVGFGGAVESARVLRGHPLFDEAALEAVERWRYSPALQDGRPVRVYVTVVVSFRLDG